MFAEEDLRPISALQHLLFCERQCALIHLEQLWAENALTITGRQLHEKVDAGRGHKRKGGPRTTRSLPLRSLALGLFGKADVVEFHEVNDVPGPSMAPDAGSTGLIALATGRPAGPLVPFPVEYKRGKPKKNRCDEVQLCAQAMCLEEMLGMAVPAGAIFYGVTRRRTDVPFDAPLRELTRSTIARLHAMFASRVTPRARREKKCDRCSLINLCLPDVLDGSESASRFVSRSLQFMIASEPGPATKGDL
jgi:CRISPR-associated exonuclease Cas4